MDVIVFHSQKKKKTAKKINNNTVALKEDQC